MLELAARGDVEAWGALLKRHEERLSRMVAFRMDRRLRARLDAADVMQEAFLAASSSREEYFRNPAAPLFLWLRGVVTNKLLELHRHHLGTRMRDAVRDVSMERGDGLAVSAEVMAVELTGHLTRPSMAAVRVETGARLREALSGMDDGDREVLALRHFEQLNNAEVAAVLAIHERAAAKRYLRALKRLKDVMAEMPGGLTGFRP